MNDCFTTLHNSIWHIHCSKCSWNFNYIWWNQFCLTLMSWCFILLLCQSMYFGYPMCLIMVYVYVFMNAFICWYITAWMLFVIAKFICPDIHKHSYGIVTLVWQQIFGLIEDNQIEQGAYLSNGKISQIWMTEITSKIHIVGIFKSSNKCALCWSWVPADLCL